VPIRSFAENDLSASPTVSAANPAAPDIIEHLCRSERLMTARELASILSISPKTLYSYAERKMTERERYPRTLSMKQAGSC
jgi:predicted DNA-binding transcriptional regulator AlpA